MTALVTDSFTRADNADLGASWNQQTGGDDPFKVLSNAAAPRDASFDAAENESSVTWPNDQYAQAAVTITSTSGGGVGIGVGLRMASAARTYYRIVADHAASNNVELAKMVAGSYTQLALRTVSWTNGNLLYAEVQGSTLILKMAGSALGASVSDSSIASGRAGITYSSTGTAPSLDTWEGGDFAGASVVPPSYISSMTPAVMRAGFH